MTPPFAVSQIYGQMLNPSLSQVCFILFIFCFFTWVPLRAQISSVVSSAQVIGSLSTGAAHRNPGPQDNALLHRAPQRSDNPQTRPARASRPLPPAVRYHDSAARQAVPATPDLPREREEAMKLLSHSSHP